MKEENQTIIRALNKYGRVPEQWELLNEIERLNNIINEIEKEVDRLLERQYKTERFAKENGFSTYLPAKINLECVKDKIQELKGSDKVMNDEVEIIEEDKKIYKLDWIEGNTFNKIQENSYLSRKEIQLLDSNFKELGNKINEIIDYINKGDE